MRRLLILCIRGYQASLSPDHGWWSRCFPHGYCRFIPSCSEYALLVIQKRGSISGVCAALGRILRCHPWSPGGIDYPT